MTFAKLMIILVFILGLIAGLLISLIMDRFSKDESIGKLMVVYDKAEPHEKPYIWLSINEEHANDITRKNKIILDVITNNHSQI